MMFIALLILMSFLLIPLTPLRRVVLGHRLRNQNHEVAPTVQRMSPIHNLQVPLRMCLMDPSLFPVSR